MPSGSLTKILPRSNNEILYLLAAFALGLFFSHMFLQSKNVKLKKCNKCNCDNECNGDCNGDCVEGYTNKKTCGES